MTFSINAEEYKKVVNSLYDLIMKELSIPQDIEAQYSKFVVMYEFFRLLRGESFTEIREPVGEYQKEIYAMEDRIFERVKEIKEQLPKDSEKVKYNMENIVSIGLKI